MSRLRVGLVAGFLILASVAAQSFAQTSVYQYFRVGSGTDKAGTPRAGFALMGGGTDQDEAFRFLCERAGGGDFLVLRATGKDDYNTYIQKLCPINSVATVVIPNRAAAEDPFVAAKIREASAVFISGGDQANYINFWMGTPVQTELNNAIKRGVPLGGTSAGLAVMGEYAYTSQGDKPDDPNLDGKTAIADPFGPRITLVRGFLDIPILKGVVTDTHFAKRDRMGRLLVFLARLNKPGARVRGIGVQEKAALLLETDGAGRVVGKGAAYFIDASNAHGTVAAKAEFNFGPYEVKKVEPGQAFHVGIWSGNAAQYTLTVENGTIRSSQPGYAVY